MRFDVRIRVWLRRVKSNEARLWRLGTARVVSKGRSRLDFFLPELAGGLPRVFEHDFVERRLRVEARVEGEGEDFLLPKPGVRQQGAELPDPVAVHQIVEVHPQLLVDHRRKLIAGNL